MYDLYGSTCCFPVVLFIFIHVRAKLPPEADDKIDRSISQLLRNVYALKILSVIVPGRPAIRVTLLL